MLFHGRGEEDEGSQRERRGEREEGERDLNCSYKPTYAAMVTKAILELKEKKGSSRQSIMKYLQGNYKVNINRQCNCTALITSLTQVEAASATLLMNKALKKMTTDERLVAGGCGEEVRA